MNTRHGHFVFVLLLASLASLPVGCSTNDINDQRTDRSKKPTESKPVIAATNIALQGMAEAIVGDFADVIRPQVQTKPDHGLDAEEVIAMQNATLVLTNGPGADDASWLNLVSLNESRVLATTSEAFELTDFIQVEDYRTVHSHGDEGEHSHPWLVPHCWLDPRLAGAQSLSILSRLTEAFPEQKSTFAAHHRALTKTLAAVEELAGEVGELVQSKGVCVIASDPRLLFFTRSLKAKDNYFLWFEPPEISAAIAELRTRDRPGGGRLLLLCPETAAPLAMELSDTTAVATATISLIEGAQEEVEGNSNLVMFVSQLRENFLNVKTAVEAMDRKE